MVGDLKYGRTVHSLSYLLGKFKNITITYVSPKQLRIGADIKKYLEKHKVKWSEAESWKEVLPEADVVYQTRIQKERFKDVKNYNKLKGSFIITKREVDMMKKKSIIMHPLPRVDEIDIEVDESPKAAYFRQASYGLHVRMALLEYLLHA